MKPQGTAATISPVNLAQTQARARVNRFLLSEVGSQFAAGKAEPDVTNRGWKFPILLVTPGFVAGLAGAAFVSRETNEITSLTGLEQIHAAAEALRERHDAEIKAAFLPARN